MAHTTHTEQFTVISSDGTMTEVTINILGTNDTPSVSNAGDVTVNEGQSANNSGAWSDADFGDL